MKKTHIKTILAFLFFTLMTGGALPAQTRVAVVSRTLSGQELWKEDMWLEVNGENAKIFIEEHAANTVAWEVLLSARHADRNNAERDLEKLKLLVDVTGKRIIMRNYIELDKGDQQPDAYLEATYRIMVPKNCNININEYFGEISVEGTSGRLIVQNEFAPVKLTNLMGRIDVESDFGDVTASNLSGDISFALSRANLHFSGIAGKIDVEASISEINLWDFLAIDDVFIQAKKSEIKTEAGQNFRYVLDLDEAEFIPAEWMKTDNPDRNEIQINDDLPAEAPLMEINLNIGKLKFR